MHQRRVDVCKSWSKQARYPQNIAFAPRRLSTPLGVTKKIVFYASSLSHSVVRYQPVALPMRYALRVEPLDLVRYYFYRSLRSRKVIGYSSDFDSCRQLPKKRLHRLIHRLHSHEKITCATAKTLLSATKRTIG